MDGSPIGSYDIGFIAGQYQQEKSFHTHPVSKDQVL